MEALFLARASLIEIFRQRYVLLPTLVLLGLLGAGLLPAPSMVVNGAPFQPDPKLLVQLAFSVLGLAGMGLGALLGAGLLSPEIERGTILLLVTKPLSRSTVVLGKALGALAFLAACFALWGGALALIVLLRAGPNLVLPTFGGTLVSMLPGALLTCVALAFSARLPTFGALAATFCAWGVAGSASLLGQVNREALPLFARIYREAAWLVPWDTLLALPKALAFGPGPEGPGLAVMLTIPLWLGVAIALFYRRDLS